MHILVDLHAEFDAMTPILLRWLDDHDSYPQTVAVYSTLQLLPIGEPKVPVDI
jgi:hypothetical protein